MTRAEPSLALVEVQWVLKVLHVQAIRLRVEGDESDKFDAGRRGYHGRNRDPGCSIGGKPVEPGRDRREGDGTDIQLVSYPEAGPVARCEGGWFVVGSAIPDRSHRVNDVPNWRVEPERRCCDRLTRRAWTCLFTGLGQLRPRSSVDRPVDASAAAQRLVRRRDDGIDMLVDDVAEYYLDVRRQASIMARSWLRPCVAGAPFGAHHSADVWSAWQGFRHPSAASPTSAGSLSGSAPCERPYAGALCRWPDRPAR